MLGPRPPRDGPPNLFTMLEGRWGRRPECARVPRSGEEARSRATREADLLQRCRICRRSGPAGAPE
eukprot:3741150-Alexandrium_andersonii.AAC.1